MCYTELFSLLPRESAYAWVNNTIVRIGFVLSPLIVGILAGQYGWGFSVKITIVFKVIALILILLFLPETTAKELEITLKLSKRAEHVHFFQNHKEFQGVRPGMEDFHQFKIYFPNLVKSVNDIPECIRGEFPAMRIEVNGEIFA